MKKALNTDDTAQDGAYLAEFLHGIKRRTSLFSTDCIDHLYQDPHEKGRCFILHHGVGGVFRLLDAHRHVRLRGEV